MGVMDPFLEHCKTCRVCAQHPRNPCSRGAALVKDGAERLTRMMLGNPSRAKA